MSRSIGLFGALALGGLVLAFVSLERWAPESVVGFPQRSIALEQAQAHARELGYRLDTPGVVGVSMGPRILARLEPLESLVRAEPDRLRRRQLLARTPPVRLGVRFWRAVAPNGSTGALLLEYDRDSCLVGASFGFDGVLRRGLPAREREYFADRLAEILLHDVPPMREESGLGGPLEFLYRRGSDQPGAYVYLGTDGAWMGELQAAPELVMTKQQGPLWNRLPAVQALVWAHGAFGLLALGVLLWRLSARRAGFGQTWPVILILLLGLVPMLGQYRGEPSVAVLIWSLYLLTQVAVVLGWAVGEAELRDARPWALEHWDRLVARQPVSDTGANLTVGVALGMVLAGMLAASGEVAGQFGGGYCSPLLVLPAYWTLPSPLNHGLALAAATAFLVGFGGRWGGRLGAAAGGAASTLGWVLVVPVAPIGWALALALPLGLAASWVAWRYGLLTLAAAVVTGLSVPTALTAWSVPEHLAAVGLVASLPLPLLLLGWVVERRAPDISDLRDVVPAYVAHREQQARLAAEVELLRKLQLSLLPDEESTRVPGVDVAWRMIPADVVGGDFLDLTEDESGRLWLAVADVAGHGISCSVLTAFTKAAVAEHAVAGSSAEEALRKVRRLFSRLHPSRRNLVTLLLAVWDPAERLLAVASAGHPPLLVADGDAVREVGTGGRPLGVMLGGEDAQEEVRCDGNAVIVAFTDGVGEAVSPSDDAFGYDRWQQLLPELCALPAGLILERLLAALDAHRAGKPANDDVTAAVLKLGP